MEVELASHGLAALRLLGDAPIAYDLVMLDLTMPFLSGHETALAIQEAFPGLPIILCSGSPEGIKKTREAASSAVVAAILKPFELADLLKVVRHTLNR